ncbi:MAG: hypothetical protein AUK03_01295 [Anaerolineae bacterium CG2_30_64_16]|nr:MAG: hypothetical protein AUK03_01295 [Anaerolineae bacterium CG2_30_64_16]
MKQHTPQSAPISNGDVVREKLPLPVVYYPAWQGTFLAFASDRRSRPVMCACAAEAVDNLFRLHPALRHEWTLDIFSQRYFPDVIWRSIARWNGNDPFPVAFIPDICHRCTSSSPALHYGDARDGPEFGQQYGWYVNQALLRMGILPHRLAYLSDACPAELQTAIEAIRRQQEELQQQCARLLDVALAGGHDQIDPGTSFDGAGLPADETQHLADLRWQASQARRDFMHKIERIVMQECGWPAAGLAVLS